MPSSSIKMWSRKLDIVLEELGGPTVPAQTGGCLVQFPVAAHWSTSAPLRTNPSSQEKVHVELYVKFPCW